MSKNKALDIVLSEFLELAKVPRPSHHEERVSEYLFQWAKSHGLAVEKDNMNEIIIDKPASPGCENVPRVIFQAHMDMVCVCEEGVTYDPMNDPIKVINDGVTLTADGTSLGADDGIGVAMCLYLLQDDTLRHGPIRAIFTTNEEDGMDSIAIDPKYLDGGYLVNLDWETLGSLCNSCAGGDFFNYSHKAEWEKPIVGCKTLTISLSGLLGGHSGVGINKGHANALVSIATLLAMLRQGGVSYRVASFSGGQAKNAIPAFGTATIVLSATEEDRAKAIIETFRAEFVEAFGNIESDMVFTTTFGDTAPDRVLTGEVGYGMVGLMTTVPNNVHTMSPLIDGLVESSANLGVVSVDEDKLHCKEIDLACLAHRGIRRDHPNHLRCHDNHTPHTECHQQDQEGLARAAGAAYGNIYLPYLCNFRFRHRDLTGFGIRIRFRYRSRARLLRAREGVEGVLGLADQRLHILEGDGGVVLILGGAVHGDETVGIIGWGALIGVDDLLLVGTGSAKICINTGTNVLQAFLQQVADRLRDLIDVLHNGGVVVENRRIRISLRACLCQSAEDQGG